MPAAWVGAAVGVLNLLNQPGSSGGSTASVPSSLPTLSGGQTGSLGSNKGAGQVMRNLQNLPGGYFNSMTQAGAAPSAKGSTNLNNKGGQGGYGFGGNAFGTSATNPTFRGMQP